jgi:hypothetical protein
MQGCNFNHSPAQADDLRRNWSRLPALNHICRVDDASACQRAAETSKLLEPGDIAARPSHEPARWNVPSLRRLMRAPTRRFGWNGPMPFLRYMIWVGAGLVALLFVMDGVLPKAAARIENEPTYKIAVTSRMRGPEAVSFNGENRVFSQPVVAEAKPVTPATEPVRDSFAKFEGTAPQRVEARAPAKKIAKRQVQKPANDYTQDPQSRYSQDVAYTRTFDAPFQRSAHSGKARF